MKHLKFVSIISIMLLILNGCALNDRINELPAFNVNDENEPIVAVSEAPDLLVFSSIEEFLSVYREVERNVMRGEAADLAESVNLTSMDRFYVPSQIPQSYQLYRITISEHSIGMWFLPEHRLATEESIIYGTSRQEHFLYHYTRTQNLDSPMEGVLRQSGKSENDLINGRYYFNGRNLFIWGSNGEIHALYTPMPQESLRANEFEIFNYDDAAVMEMVNYTATTVINLNDTRAVDMLIGDFELEGFMEEE